MDDALLLKIEEVGRRMSLGRSVVYRLIQTGELASVKIGGSRRVLTSDLDAFVARLKQEPEE